MNPDSTKLQLKTLRQGSALIAIFWIMSILGLAVFATMNVVKLQSDIVSSDIHGYRAKQLAEQGIAVAAARDQIKRSDSLLSFNNGTEGYEATYNSLNTTIGFNALIKRTHEELTGQSAAEGEAPVSLENTYFGLLLTQEWGMSLQDAVVFLSNLIEWIDAGDVVTTQYGWERLNYESEGIEGRPFNRPFYTFDEVALVEGYEEFVTAVPDWRRYFNLWSEVSINIVDADAEMISLASISPSGRQITIEDAQSFKDYIIGDDGIRDTEDDIISPNQSTLGLYADPALVAELFTVLRYNVSVDGGTGKHVIESFGWSGDVGIKINLVVEGQGGSASLIERRETLVEKSYE